VALGGKDRFEDNEALGSDSLVARFEEMGEELSCSRGVRDLFRFSLNKNKR
jgi:hypothetical protein